MRFISALSLVFVATVLGAPARVPVIKRAGPFKANSYLVTFNDDAAKNDFVQSKPAFTQPDSRIIYDWNLSPAITMNIPNNIDLNILRAVRGIKLIEQDSIVSVNYEQGIDGFDPVGYKAPTKTPEPQAVKRSGTGEGVVAYGVDTGVYVEHNCFGGRAKWGVVYGGYPQEDGNGHGTHTAATIAGNKYGIATSAHVVAVKVLGPDGSGATSDVISGINYSVGHCLVKGLCIVNLSLGGPVSSATDDAVKAGIAQGVHFTVAAGNSYVSAAGTSPARVPEANTIAAIDKSNEKALFSNWGSPVDLFALGVNVTSAWIGSPDAEHTISGTSMAAPLAVACAAITLGDSGSMSPADLSNRLKKDAKSDVTFAAADILAKASTTKKRISCDPAPGAIKG